MDQSVEECSTGDRGREQVRRVWNRLGVRNSFSHGVCLVASFNSR